MTLARLPAKGWVVVCLFVGAHAVHLALQSGGFAVSQVIVSVVLFAAMGLLFVGGYGVSGTSIRMVRWQDFKPRGRPGFNDMVFLSFAAASFLNQVLYAPLHVRGKLTEMLEGALYFAVPGHAALVDRLGQCSLDGGRVFASSFAWILAFVFAGSAISRLRLAAGLIRMERTLHPDRLSATAVAAVLGVAAVLAIQCIFVGSPTGLIPCDALASVPGALLIGLAPLLLAYLIFAALAALLASGNDSYVP